MAKGNSMVTVLCKEADVDISPNPNPFNFWTAESEYIKKLESEYLFFSKLKESVNPIGQNSNESIYGLESEYISLFAIEYEYNLKLVRDMDLSPFFVQWRNFHDFAATVFSQVNQEICMSSYAWDIWQSYLFKEECSVQIDQYST